MLQVWWQATWGRFSVVPLAKNAFREATNAPLLQVNSFLAKEMQLAIMIVMQLLY